MCLKHRVTLWIYFHLMLWIKVGVPIRPVRSHMRNMFDRGIAEWWLNLNEKSWFRKRHSIATALIKITCDLLFNVDNDTVSGMVLVDWHGRSRTFTEETGGLWQKSSKSSVRVVRSCPVQNKCFILAERNRVSHWLNMESLKVEFWFP